jgi:hypothetical protein
MKTENVTLTDCRTSIYHSSNIALDSLHIDIKCTELSQIQRLIAICGGELTVFSAVLELSENVEKIYWVRWNSVGNAYLTAMCNITELSYQLLIAGLSGNNCVRFNHPTTITMIDNNYFVLPEDNRLFKLDFSLARGIQDQVKD